VLLHCYAPPADLPKGIEIADACALLPETRVVKHRKNGSYSVFSDLLRLEILKQGRGLYVDCDVYCLKPIQDEQYILGNYWGNALNAVLKVPPDCPVLADLQPILDGTFIPPWAAPHFKLRLYLRRLMGKPLPGCDQFPVGWTGTKAFTWYAKKRGIFQHAKPRETYFSFYKQNWPMMLDASRKFEELISPEAVAVHLWNDYYVRKGFEGMPIPAASPLGRLIAAEQAD
jgi:hypothetical protein